MLERVAGIVVRYAHTQEKEKLRDAACRMSGQCVLITNVTMREAFGNLLNVEAVDNDFLTTAFQPTKLAISALHAVYSPSWQKFGHQYGGGDLMMYVNDDLADVELRNVSSHGSRGPINFESAHSVNLSNVLVENSQVSDRSLAGGIQFVKLHSDVTMETVEIANSIASYGGAVRIEKPVAIGEFKCRNVRCRNNFARVAGGCVYSNNDATDVVGLQNCFANVINNSGEFCIFICEKKFLLTEKFQATCYGDDFASDVAALQVQMKKQITIGESSIKIFAQV